MGTHHWSELTGDEMRARWGYAAAGLDDQEHLHAAVSSGPSRLGTEQPLLPPADAESPSDRLRSTYLCSVVEEPTSVRSNSGSLFSTDPPSVVRSGADSPSTPRHRGQSEIPSPAKPT